MKEIIMAGIVGMVLISFASAGLVGFLSNSVSASVEVSGPVFYLDRTDIMGDSSFSLKLNDNNINGNWFRLKSDNSNSREFFSESLGVDGFYPLDFEVTIDAKINNLNESLGESGSIHMFIFLSRESGSVREIISLCDTIYLGVNDVRDIHVISCDVGNALVDINPSDRIKVLLNDGSPSESEIKVYLGESKMQMVAK